MKTCEGGRRVSKGGGAGDSNTGRGVGKADLWLLRGSHKATEPPRHPTATRPRPAGYRMTIASPGTSNWRHTTEEEGRRGQRGEASRGCPPAFSALPIIARPPLHCFTAHRDLNILPSLLPAPTESAPSPFVSLSPSPFPRLLCPSLPSPLYLLLAPPSPARPTLSFPWAPAHLGNQLP